MSTSASAQRVYIETYGCQMNEADSEIVGGILGSIGYLPTAEIADADVVLVNTCAIRDNAEQRIYGRLGLISRYKRENPGLLVGILGCMAERLRNDLLEQELVDLVVGPDQYRELPSLIEKARGGERGIAVRLSRVESYDDIQPLRTGSVTAWVSVMRGCDKFCTFCVVPFTRGRERSRPLRSVVHEVEELSRRGFREVTLLGQNVNSYRDDGCDFADLIRAVAAVDSTMRVRFTTSHPQDMSRRLIDAIAEEPNICKHVHLPLQSGSDRVLQLMNRTYSVDQFRDLVRTIRSVIPGVALSTDIISGFPSESLEEHRMTIDVIQELRFDGAFTFKYSAREKTKAWELNDNISEEEKGRRVWEITDIQHGISLEKNQAMIGSVVTVLVEGPSRKSPRDYTGRTGRNQTVVFQHGNEQCADYVQVGIERVTSATLMGACVGATHREL